MARLSLGLTAEQRAARRGCLGASDANILMSGDPERIHALWLEKTGQAESEDLSRVLPVQIGSFTEEFNRFWFELTTGREITHEGEQRRSSSHPFMGLTLDGLTTTAKAAQAVFEAKHVNAFSKLDDVCERYMGQLHHAMHVTGFGFAILSVLHGTQGYEAFEVECDWVYQAQLIDREAAFWRCVEAREPPGSMVAIAAPVVPGGPVKLRDVDMTTSNAWAAQAADWLANKAAAKKFKDADQEIKALVEADVGKAFGHGIIVSRSKVGALTIREIRT